MLVDIKKRKARKIKMEWWDIKDFESCQCFALMHHFNFPALQY